jgi:hypothetical protein
LCYSQLTQGHQAGIVNPAHAMKATKEARDAVFTKLDCYVKNLNAMGLTKDWKSFEDIPAECIYNMDEAGTDTTKSNLKYYVKQTLQFKNIAVQRKVMAR